MKVKTLIRFKDLEKDTIREVGEVFEVTKKRVGIDVANASVMVIYDAHRFGLSTLHQLRGRVARDKKQGYCFLLSASSDPQAIERLKKMEELKELPFIQVDQKNNMRQRSTPAAKLYKELLQQYTNCVKILEAVIYRNRKLEGPEEEASPLEEWLMNHADSRKKDLDTG